MKERRERYERDHAQLVALRKAAFVLLLLLASLALAVALSGCSQFDRDYQAQYDVSSGRYSAGVRLTPGTGRRSLSAGVTGDINWSMGPKFFPDK